MNWNELVAHYCDQLRHDPKTPAPAARPRTHQELVDHKQHLRAYDRARLALRLVTPQELSDEAAWVRVDPTAHRIVRFAQYA